MSVIATCHHPDKFIKHFAEHWTKKKSSYINFQMCNMCAGCNGRISLAHCSSRAICILTTSHCSCTTAAMMMMAHIYRMLPYPHRNKIYSFFFARKYYILRGATTRYNDNVNDCCIKSKNMNTNDAIQSCRQDKTQSIRRCFWCWGLLYV